jgi:hypothetical protein
MSGILTHNAFEGGQCSDQDSFQIQSQAWIRDIENDQKNALLLASDAWSGLP